MNIKNNIPDRFRILLEEEQSEELGKMYNFLFDYLFCSWAGRIGHYPYDENPNSVSKNQDGYIYCIKEKWQCYHKISADQLLFKGLVTTGYIWPTLNWRSYNI